MDWTILITIASIIGTVANIYKKRWCFIIWLFTNGFWCVYDISIGAYSQAFLFAVYFMLAIHGLVKWRAGEAMDKCKGCLWGKDVGGKIFCL